MRAVSFFAVVSAFTFGIAVQTLWPLPIEMIILTALISLAVAAIWRRNHTRVAAPYLLVFSLLLCSLAVGLLRTEIASWQFGVSSLQSQVGEEITLVGTVSQEPRKSANTTQFFIQTEQDKVLVSTDRHSNIEYGDVVAVAGKLTVPQSFVTDLGRTFDYPSYLKAKGVEYKISFATVELRDTGQGNILLASLLTTKKAFMKQLEKVIPEPQVGLGEGLLLGVKQALGEDIENNFRRTGIIHIVVLSGYNVMLVVTFFMLIFSAVLSPRKQVVAGVVAITCFALLVGLSATVVRASIMAVLLLLAQGFSRQYDVMRALFFAGVVMLLLNPYLLLYDIGFQLSFMATLGLLLIIPHFESTVVSGLKKLRLKDFFLATLATQIAVLPLLLYHIGEVSVVAVLVNVLVLPIVPTAMSLTFATGLLAFVSMPAAAIVGYLANLSLLYILLIAAWFAKLQFATLSIPEFSAWGMFVLYGMMAAVFGYKKIKPVAGTLSDWVIEEEKENPPAAFAKAAGGLNKNNLPKIFR